MTDKTDRTLEEFLDGKSSVSRGYAELPDRQPPAALDRKILAAARAAVGGEQDATVVRVRRWHRWSVPAALAATVVVAVPLVVRVVDLELGEPQPALETVATNRDAAAGPDAGADTTPIDFAEPAGYLPQPEASLHTDAAIQRQDEEMTDSGDGEFAPAPERQAAAPVPGVPGESAAASSASDRQARQRRSVSEAAANRQEPLGQRSDDTMIADLPVPAEPTRSEALAAAPVADEDSRDLMAMKTAASPAPGSMAASLGAQRPDYLTAGAFIDRIVASYRSDRPDAARREFGEFLVMYPEADLPPDFPLARSEAIYPQRNIVQEAEDWLQGIASLHAQGRIDAARQQLARFYERYPDYELPDWFPLDRDDAAPIER